MQSLKSPFVPPTLPRLSSILSPQPYLFLVAIEPAPNPGLWSFEQI